MQCGERAHAAVSRRQGIADRYPHPRRGPIRIADYRAPSAHRLANPAVAGPASIGPALAIAGHPHDDQPRVERVQSVWAKSPLFKCAGLEVLNQDIGIGQQPPDQILALGHPQIRADRALVAGDHLPPQLVRPMAPTAHRIASSGRLDLDHVGSHIAQQLPAKRPGDQLAQLDHLDPGQRPGVFGFAHAASNPAIQSRTKVAASFTCGACPK